MFGANVISPLNSFLCSEALLLSDRLKGKSL